MDPQGLARWTLQVQAGEADRQIDGLPPFRRLARQGSGKDLEAAIQQRWVDLISGGLIRDGLGRLDTPPGLAVASPEARNPLECGTIGQAGLGQRLVEIGGRDGLAAASQNRFAWL